MKAKILHAESKPVYIISVAAELIGVHPRTIRIYEEMGFVKPWRTKSNIRLFSQEDILRIKQIGYLIHEKGLNLAGIKILLKVLEHFDRDIEEIIEEIF